MVEAVTREGDDICVPGADGGPGVWMLDRQSPVPLYLQIRQRLIALAAAWPDPARRFYSDDELAERFDVTRMTVRQAAADLVHSGLLTRLRGSGTFVETSAFAEQLTPGIDPDRRPHASAQTTEVIGFGLERARARARRTLQIDDDAEVLVIRRVRSLAGVTLAFDERTMSKATAETAGFTAQNAAESIVDRLRATHPLGRASWDLRAVGANAFDAALLRVAEGEPLLERSITYRDATSAPLLHGRTVHRSDLLHCRFDMEIGAGATNHDLDEP